MCICSEEMSRGEELQPEHVPMPSDVRDDVCTNGRLLLRRPDLGVRVPARYGVVWESVYTAQPVPVPALRESLPERADGGCWV